MQSFTLIFIKTVYKLINNKTGSVGEHDLWQNSKKPDVRLF